MLFCPDCNNLLFPKRNNLYCKICNEEFEFGTSQKEYKINTIMKDDEKYIEPVIIKKIWNSIYFADLRKDPEE